MNRFELINHPWPCLHIKKFFPPLVLSRIESLLPRTNGFDIYKDHPLKLKYKVINDIDVYRHFLSKKFKNQLFKIAGRSFSLDTKTGLQFRLMTKDSPEFPPHIDLINSPTLVMIVYLSTGWKSENGGELVLMKSKRSFQRNITKIIPEYNSAVFFWAEKNNYHMINKVLKGNRYSIVGEWHPISKSGGNVKSYI